MKKLSGEWKIPPHFFRHRGRAHHHHRHLAPNREDRDPTPGTWNSGAAGAKAAYLLLGQLGYDEARWERPESELSAIDAPTPPWSSPSLRPPLPRSLTKNRQQPFVDFLHHGGRIVATGATATIFCPVRRPRLPIESTQTFA